MPEAKDVFYKVRCEIFEAFNFPKHHRYHRIYCHRSAAHRIASYHFSIIITFMCCWVSQEVDVEPLIPNGDVIDVLAATTFAAICLRWDAVVSPFKLS